MRRHRHANIIFDWSEVRPLASAKFYFWKFAPGVYGCVDLTTGGLAATLPSDSTLMESKQNTTRWKFSLCHCCCCCCSSSCNCSVVPGTAAGTRTTTSRTCLMWSQAPWLPEKRSHYHEIQLPGIFFFFFFLSSRLQLQRLTKCDDGVIENLKSSKGKLLWGAGGVKIWNPNPGSLRLHLNFQKERGRVMVEGGKERVTSEPTHISSANVEEERRTPAHLPHSFQHLPTAPQLIPARGRRRGEGERCEGEGEVGGKKGRNQVKEGERRRRRRRGGGGGETTEASCGFLFTLTFGSTSGKRWVEKERERERDGRGDRGTKRSDGTQPVQPDSG